VLCCLPRTVFGLENHLIIVDAQFVCALVLLLVGEIQFEEFVAVMSRKVQANYSADEVKSAFKVFETSGAPAGCIKLESLQRALSEYGSDRITQDQVSELLQQIECDSNGYFNYVEYVHMMCSE
jgi:calmodulin